MKVKKPTAKQRELRTSWEALLKKYKAKQLKSKPDYRPVLPMQMANLPARTTREEFDRRIKKVSDGQSLTPIKEHNHKSSDHCIMPMHKGGYQVVTDPQLIPLMGKKP